MALPIPPGIFDRTVDLITMIISDIGSSVGKLIEVDDLDEMEIEIRQTTGLDFLWNMINRRWGNNY